MEGDVIPDIDDTKNLSIVLHIDRSSIEIPIQFSFEVEFGKQLIGTKYTYYEEALERENSFYIDEIYAYDIYEEVLKNAEQMEDENVRKGMIKHMKEAMENLGLRDKSMAVIRYETEDNVKLNFMMKDYLEAEPVHSSTGVSFGLISNPDKIGTNGYKQRECLMQPVDKDFSGKLELELFSRIVQVPEETVKCTKI